MKIAAVSDSPEAPAWPTIDPSRVGGKMGASPSDLDSHRSQFLGENVFDVWFVGGVGAHDADAKAFGSLQLGLGGLLVARVVQTEVLDAEGNRTLSFSACSGRRTFPFGLAERLKYLNALTSA